MFANSRILVFENKSVNGSVEKALVRKANEIFKKTQALSLSLDNRDSKKIYKTSVAKSNIKRLSAPIDWDVIRIDLSQAFKNKVQDDDNSWDRILHNQHKTFPLDPAWDKKFWEYSDKNPKQ